ncbi:MAG: hypothetical protein ACFE75_03025 [Candidatus Hodarchaeota archaeon]
MKHPPIQYSRNEAYQLTEEFKKVFSEATIPLINKMINQNEKSIE